MSSDDRHAAAVSYPDELECDVLLSDGRSARLRAIRPSDAPLLRSFGARLSRETVYFRFFAPRREIGDEEISHLVTVDYQDRLALVAIVDGELVAVARYDRLPTGAEEPLAASTAPTTAVPQTRGAGEAEVAFVVRDDHQGRGLGTVMLEHLASAAVARGIGRFVADVLTDNHRMIGVFRSAGFDEQVLVDAGVIRVTLELAAQPEYIERVEEREWTAAVRSIQYILRPRSIAVIGAGPEPGSAGHDIVANLVAGGFKGGLYPVNGQAVPVSGLKAYASVSDVPGDIDLALLAVPAHRLSEVVRECGMKAVRGLVAVTSGEEGRERGESTDRELVELARTFGMRLVGPDSMGVINNCPGVQMNATFAERPPPPGRVAFSAQSGGLGIALFGELAARGLGISSFASLGNKADVSGNDLLRFWEGDPETDAILLYLESFGNPRKFSRIARRVAQKTPIVAVKSGRTPAGLRGVHGKTSGAVLDEATDALFRQAGVIRVQSLEELLDVADVLVNQPLPAGRRVGIVANAGGCGVLAADACEGYGLEVPELAPETQSKLLGVVSQGAVVRNPVDLAASATAEEYSSVLNIVLADDDIDVVIVTFTPPVPVGAGDVAEAVSRAAATTTKTVVANFIASEETLLGLRADPRHVPWFGYPESAARAVARVAQYGEWVARPEGTVPSFEDLDRDSARRIVDQALETASSPARGPAGSATYSVWLDTVAAFSLLQAYGIPILACLRAASVPEAVQRAEALGYPVALKLDAPEFVHKSDLGGVRLDLGSGEEVAAAAEALLAMFGPGVQLVVQPMGPGGVETVVGVVEDPSFGPLVMFGLGGKEAELFGDRIWSLVPMTAQDARELVRGLRSSPLLTGYRGSAPVDLEALSDLLSRVACLAEDLPEVVELSLNPVVASPGGVMALDARVRVAASVHEPPLMRRAMRSA
jgi:acyl-CoA synthetase (NDP forming)/RimJ/RimL family protein N-acetyltransferase